MKKLSHFADLPVQIEPLFIRLGRRQLTLADAQIWQPTPLYLTPSKTKIAIFNVYSANSFQSLASAFPASSSTFLLILIVGPRFKRNDSFSTGLGAKIF